MGLRQWCGVCAVGALGVLLVSCSTPSGAGAESPAEVVAWPGHPGELTDWGKGDGYVYGVLPAQGSDGQVLVLWRWSEGTMRKSLAVTLPHSRLIRPISNELCGLAVSHEGALLELPCYESRDMTTNRVVAKWDAPKGWGFVASGASTNRRWVAVLAREGPGAPQHNWDHPPVKIGLIDAVSEEMRWVGSLQGHGAGTIREVAVTEDGRYVAVAGWNNGTAMIDVAGERVLWAQRPEHEISTGYAAFAADGKSVYTAGSEGCVYTLDVTTGSVLGQRWATATGESIYPHRVSSLALSRDGKWLAVGTVPEGEVYVWNLEQGGVARVLMHRDGPVVDISFSPDSQCIATVGGGFLKTWKL